MRDFILAEPVDMSTGFSDFFGTIAMSAGGIVTKAVAAVIAIVAVIMVLTLPKDPKLAMRKGSMAVGALFVAIVLALYGGTLFGTVTNAPKPPASAPKAG